jgi:hypothetical protein
MDLDALDAHFDAKLPVGVGGVAALAPWREVEIAATLIDGTPVQEPLPIRRLGEDDEELFRIVFDYLEVTMAQMHPVANGLPNVIRLHVVAVGVQPADHDPIDEVVTAALDGARCHHRAVAARRPCPRVTRVPRRHGLGAANHFHVGAGVRLGRWWVAMLEDGCLQLRGRPGFMQLREVAGGDAFRCPVVRTVAFPTLVGGPAEA